MPVGCSGLAPNWIRNCRNSQGRHVQDLLALTIGATDDFKEIARTRGLRAARLKLSKAYIVEHSYCGAQPSTRNFDRERGGAFLCNAPLSAAIVRGRRYHLLGVSGHATPGTCSPAA